MLVLVKLHAIHILVDLIGVQHEINHSAQALVDHLQPWISGPRLALSRLLQVVSHRCNLAHLPHC